MDNDKEKFFISSMKQDEKSQFVKFHIDYLWPWNSSNILSKIYLEKRFEYLLGDESLIKLCAKNESGEIIGIIYGGKEGYKKIMNRSIFIRNPFLVLSNSKGLFDILCQKIISLISRKNDFDYRFDINRTCRLTGIMVDRKYSGHGVGSRLIQQFEYISKQFKFNSVVVRTQKENLAAKIFYVKNGYMPITVFKNRKHLLLYKNLSD